MLIMVTSNIMRITNHGKGQKSYSAKADWGGGLLCAVAPYGYGKHLSNLRKPERKTENILDRRIYIISLSLYCV